MCIAKPKNLWALQRNTKYFFTSSKHRDQSGESRLISRGDPFDGTLILPV